MQTFAEFLTYCRTLDGRWLQTPFEGRSFKLAVLDTAVCVVPESSGSPHRISSREIERVLLGLAESNDWRPGRYKHLSRHASYILGVVRHLQEEHMQTGLDETAVRQKRALLRLQSTAIVKHGVTADATLERLMDGSGYQLTLIRPALGTPVTVLATNRVEVWGDGYQDSAPLSDEDEHERLLDRAMTRL